MRILMLASVPKLRGDPAMSKRESLNRAYVVGVAASLAAALLLVAATLTQAVGTMQVVV